MKLEKEHKQKKEKMIEFEKIIGFLLLLFCCKHSLSSPEREREVGEENTRLKKMVENFERRSTEFKKREEKLLGQLSLLRRDLEEEKTYSAKFEKESMEVKRVVEENTTLRSNAVLNEKLAAEERDEREELKEEVVKLRNAISKMVRVNKDLQQEMEEMNRCQDQVCLSYCLPDEIHSFLHSSSRLNSVEQTQRTAVYYQKRIENLELELSHISQTETDSLLDEIHLTKVTSTPALNKYGGAEEAADGGEERRVRFRNASKGEAMDMEKNPNTAHPVSIQLERKVECAAEGIEEGGRSRRAHTEWSQKSKGDWGSLEKREGGVRQRKLQGVGVIMGTGRGNVGSLLQPHTEEIMKLRKNQILDRFSSLSSHHRSFYGEEDLALLQTCLQEDEMEGAEPQGFFSERIQKLREEVSSDGWRTQASAGEMLVRSLLELCEDQSSRMLVLRRLACGLKRDIEFLREQEQLFLNFILECRVLLDASQDSLFSDKMTTYMDRTSLFEISDSVIDTVENSFVKEILSSCG